MHFKNSGFRLIFSMHNFHFEFPIFSTEIQFFLKNLFFSQTISIDRRTCYGEGKIQGYWRRSRYCLCRAYPQRINSKCCRRNRCSPSIFVSAQSILLNFSNNSFEIFTICLPSVSVQYFNFVNFH